MVNVIDVGLVELDSPWESYGAHRWILESQTSYQVAGECVWYCDLCGARKTVYTFPHEAPKVYINSALCCECRQMLDALAVKKEIEAAGGVELFCATRLGWPKLIELDGSVSLPEKVNKEGKPDETISCGG